MHYPGIPIEKLLLDGEPSSPAVDTICHTVEQASPIPLPAVAAPPPTDMLTIAATPPTEAPAVAASPRAMVTSSSQTLSVTTQCSSLAAATEFLIIENKAVIETLRPVNDEVSIIDDSPFPLSNAPRLLIIGILQEIHLSSSLVIDFPGVGMDIKASLEGVGLAANHVVTGQQHNLVQALHAVLSGLVQLILNTLITLVGCGKTAPPADIARDWPNRTLTYA
uniref:Uncharacterized protein n=1 Tax=Romanomermis culicivorax TaxID=13658 RepID=A0A915JZ25_ROMCU